MDEAFDGPDWVAESGFEDVFAWVLRAIGIVLALVGVGLWVLPTVGWGWRTACVLAAAAFFLVSPQLLVFVSERLARDS